MVTATGISGIFDEHFEWLAIRENGRTISLRRDEIDIETIRGGVMIGFVADEGQLRRRVVECRDDGSSFSLVLAAAFGGGSEAVSFIPRESAASLAENIELARLQRANKVAHAVLQSFPEYRLGRVSLSIYNGRLAHIFLNEGRNIRAAVVSDVTSSLTHETMLASAVKWLESLRSRKKAPLNEVYIAASKRRAGNLRRLHALLKKGIRSRINIIELTENSGEITSRVLRPINIYELWRAKPQKLKLPDHIETSKTAQRILRMASDKIDVIHASNGETIRFRGLPFVRVRKMPASEQAWFGVTRSRKLLNERTEENFHDLLDDLMRFRDAEPPSKRHDLYRLASETWLESILRRNIKLLDPNLILSPIYSQFKTAADKIDLLALRRDGRLVIIELKTSPDRETVFQAADYWRKIELQRRRGLLADARLFGDMEIADRPALVYVVAPALSFHRDFENFAAMLSPEIELWRWELHEDWREKIKVHARINYSGRA